MDNTTGTLLVQVYTSRAELPVRDATVVVIRRAPSGKYELISIQSTDSSGKINTIQIDTPVPAESTSPNGLPGDGAPCALCSVWAEQPGYAMLQVENVQVFPGVETVQNMELIPLPQGLCSLQQRDERDIPVQNL